MLPSSKAVLKKSVLCALSFLTLSGCNWPTSQSSQVSLSTELASEPAPIALGRQANFDVHVTDTEHGICLASAVLWQNQKQIALTLAPLQQAAEKKPTQLTYNVSGLDLPSLGFEQGPATIAVHTQNCSIFKGKTDVQKTVTLDFTPPRLALTSSQHYINAAGADVATYSVSEDAVWSGVQVGPYKFRGYARPNLGTESSEHFAFFVFSYDLPQDTPIELVAIDAAGNQSKATLIPSKFFPKEFRKRDIPIDDGFIQTKVEDIIANTPKLKPSGDSLTDFLMVNSDLRKENAQFLRDLATKSEEKFFWKDAFRPLVNASIEASFADYRSYFYNGEKVDEQVHLGFDMAVVEHHPILAAANGKVMFSGYLGIYGNTVILDHGYGLMTLYAHMSALDVKEGDMVTMDQKLGNSGATGLAGGDHLHFSMLIQGVQTNPIEFWDQHWIQDHVYLRLNGQAFGQL